MEYYPKWFERPALLIPEHVLCVEWFPSSVFGGLSVGSGMDR